MKRSESTHQVFVRFTKSDRTKADLEKIATSETKAKGRWVSVNCLAKAALKAYVASWKRDRTMPVTPFKLDFVTKR